MDLLHVENHLLSHSIVFNEQDMDALEHLEYPSHGWTLGWFAFLVRDKLFLCLQLFTQFVFG
jgi:hypothetical protein